MDSYYHIPENAVYNSKVNELRNKTKQNWVGLNNLRYVATLIFF